MKDVQGGMSMRMWFLDVGWGGSESCVVWDFGIVKCRVPLSEMQQLCVRVLLVARKDASGYE